MASAHPRRFRKGNPRQGAAAPAGFSPYGFQATSNLVVVCESPNPEAEMRAIFHAIDAIIREHPDVGAYDQTI